jgi:hypothetical protein
MSPARYVLTVPGWLPARVNQWDGRHWARRHRLKRSDRELVAVYSRQVGIPQAAGRRRVSLVLTLGPRQRAGDPDAYWKSALDALVACRLLVDDSRQQLQLGTVTFRRGPARQTRIVLQDLAGAAASRRV